MPRSEAALFGRLMGGLAYDPVGFNKIVLGRVHPSIPNGYWDGQVPVLESVLRHRHTVVPAGHAVGKSFLASGCGLHYLYTRPHSRVILLGPSYRQVSEVLWPEVTKAWKGARIRLPGKITSGNSLKITVADKWELLCGTADSDPEAMAGRHAGNMLVICDESSWEGYDDALETLEGLNAERYLLIGNPLRNGRFKQLCDRADGKSINRIQISSLQSPHAQLDRSPVGLADRGYLDSMKAQHGEDSPVYRVRVLGQFNDDDQHTLIPSSWLVPRTPNPPAGPKILSVDISKGTGKGDKSVIVVRDRDSLYDLQASASWSYPEGVAERVKAMASEHGITGKDVIYDRGGLGEAFGHVLANVGLHGAYGYVGGSDGGRLATNFRGASALALKRRLDPSRNTIPFAIPPNIVDILKPQIAELRYELAPNDKIKLEPKEAMRGRLGRSPDELDALIQSFCR